MGLPEIKAKLDALATNLQDIRADVDAIITPTPPPPPSIPTVRIRPGDDVIAAIRSLDTTGGRILAYPGDYNSVGSAFKYFVRTGTKPIYLKSDTQNLPPEGERITPEFAPDLAIFRAMGSFEGVFVLPNKSSGLYFQGIGFGPCAPDRTVIALGGDKNNMRTTADRPFDFLFDRVLFLGDPVKGQHLAIRLSGKDLTIIGCWFKDFFEVGRDSQALGGSNGPENIVIENCHIEGGAENVMLGGSDAASLDMRPRNITIRGNHILKNFAWKSLVPQPTIKALFELKNVDTCLFEYNLLEQNWPQAWPDGVAITVKAVNQEGGNHWASCQDVIARYNVVRNVGAFMTLIGKNDGPYISDFSRRIMVHDNVCLALSQGNWQGTGKAFRVNNPGEDIHYKHNTIINGKHSFLEVWQDADVPPNGARFRFVDSVVPENDYGIFKSGTPGGKAALDSMFPNGYEFKGNAIRNDPVRNITYPDGNALVAPTDWASSFDAIGRVKPDSAVDLATRGKTTDGKRVGADVDMIVAGLNDKVE